MPARRPFRAPLTAAASVEPRVRLERQEVGEVVAEDEPVEELGRLGQSPGLAAAELGQLLGRGWSA